MGRVVEKSRIPTALLGLQSSRRRDSDCISGSACPEVDTHIGSKTSPWGCFPIPEIAACSNYALPRLDPGIRVLAISCGGFLLTMDCPPIAEKSCARSALPKTFDLGELPPAMDAVLVPADKWRQ